MLWLFADLWDSSYLSWPIQSSNIQIPSQKRPKMSQNIYIYVWNMSVQCILLSFIHIVREIWWPVQETGRFRLHLGYSWRISKSWHRWLCILYTERQWVMEIIIMVNLSLCSFLQDFETNSFEQMCINFANETLQFFFNQFVFRMEQVSVTLQYYTSHRKFILVVCHAR